MLYVPKRGKTKVVQTRSNQFKTIMFDNSHLRIALLSSLKVSILTTASQWWAQGRQPTKVVSRLMLMFPVTNRHICPLDSVQEMWNVKWNTPSWEKQWGTWSKESKILRERRRWFIWDPRLWPTLDLSIYSLLLFHFSTQILPGPTVSSCTDRLNPTLTPGRGDKMFANNFFE